MKFVPISSDSLGVRSLSVYVETKDLKMIIDPSAALGPSRYGLPPHPKEIEALERTKREIERIAKDCDLFVISHYHYDHYDPEAEFFEGKRIFAKDIEKNINASQKSRGKEFKERFEERSEIVYCDDTVHKIGSTEIRFSPPFFHGPANVRLGYVIMTTVDDGDKKLLHASDVQGPVTEEAKDYIIDQDPDILIIDGPPTIFLGWKFSRKNLEDAIGNMIEIVENTGAEIILDHHLLRDLKYREQFANVYRIGGKRIKTFAEYLGKENIMLEAHRKELWEREG
ncbi:MAG TPA: MBL fold metallo-hydrolase [Thermoplasmatales archaeon]|nr:MBL fold metallo-hydrolase [Thermoplasmatales archaeon]HEX16877.1 MBL fold metallo-hydrolase [Thermoplasmatales archaeon]